MPDMNPRDVEDPHCVQSGQLEPKPTIRDSADIVDHVRDMLHDALGLNVQMDEPFPSLEELAVMVADRLESTEGSRMTIQPEPDAWPLPTASIELADETRRQYEDGAYPRTEAILRLVSAYDAKIRWETAASLLDDPRMPSERFATTADLIAASPGDELPDIRAKKNVTKLVDDEELRLVVSQSGEYGRVWASDGYSGVLFWTGVERIGGVYQLRGPSPIQADSWEELASKIARARFVVGTVAVAYPDGTETRFEV